MALLARLCSSCSRLPSAEEQRLCERALRSPSRSPRSRHRAISDSRHNIVPPSHTIRIHHVQKSAPTPDLVFHKSTFLVFTLFIACPFVNIFPFVVFACGYFNQSTHCSLMFNAVFTISIYWQSAFYMFFKGQ